MPDALGTNGDQSTDLELIQSAIDLLSQQTWCWGQDILRPEGNWLVEIGFDRIEPPTDQEDCSSLYVLELPHGRCVMLRGFGVFYGCQHQGGVFLPRYEFRPKYTRDARLRCQPWTDSDVRSLDPPDDSQRDSCVSLTLDLINWIRDYEVNVADHLGMAYRQSTLVQWDNGKRNVTPAEMIATAWGELSIHVAEDFDAYTGRVPT